MQSEFYSWSELFPDYEKRHEMMRESAIAFFQEDDELSLAEE